jgi:recombination protein RecA
MIRGLRDKKVFYIDTEASLNPSLLVKLELVPANFHLWNKSAFIEDMYDVLLEAAKSGEYDLIVLDSLASCTTKTEAEGDITASNIGQKAKMVNKMMRIIPSELKNSDTALVIINQEREVIGGYVPVKYTPGGMGVPYAASLMISLKTIKSWRFGRTASDTKAGKYIGHEIQVEIIKSKVNQPWRRKMVKLYYPEPVEVEMF